MRRELILAVATVLVVAGALIGMTRVFVGPGWVGGAVSAVVLATAIAAGARRVGFGAIGAAVGSVVGLSVFTYVLHLPAGPLIPGVEQLAQAAELFTTGLEQLQEEPAPTSPLPGLLLIVTTGVWITTHITHELLVRWRRPGLALIPPTVLWAVPLAMPQPPGQTWRHTIPFLATAGLVLLLESDADVVAWARDRHGPRISASGATVGGIALAVAAIAPGLLPGYQQSAWLDLVGGADPTGYQPIVDVGDRLQLPDPRPALRVESPRPVYLRLAALDTFDTNTWRLGPPGSTSFRPEESQLFSTTEPLPPEVPLGAADEVMIQVEVLDLENIYVPVPYQAQRILGPSRSDMVYSQIGGFVATGELQDNEIGGQLRTGVVPGFQYRVVSEVPAPDPEALRQVEFRPVTVAPWTQLPGSSDGRYRRYAELAEEHYAAAGADTVLDRVLALQSWFTSSAFEYSTTDVDALRGPTALEDFVFESRVGYCEYFATAMAVMLRATDIPARVAVGFLPGEIIVPADPANGVPATYEVSTSDAHAWVEVLFPGHGWIKFDPTPRADGATLPPTGDELDPLLTEAQRDQITERDVTASELPTEPDAAPTTGDLPPGLENDGEDGSAGAQGDGLPWIPLVLGLLATAGAAVALSARRARAHHPELAPPARVLAAQRRLLVAARSLGTGRRPSETAGEVTRRWAEEGRVDPTTAARFTALAQAAAFGGVLAPEAGEHAELLVDDLVEGLRRSVEPADRLLAPVRVPLETGAAVARDVTDRARRLVTADRD